MFSRIQLYWEMLTTDPLGFVVYMLYFAAVVLISLILHECAHGYVALRCGDPTAKILGRITLDPRKHLDPIGTVAMMLIGVGWAKPVPVNPRNFRRGRRDDFLVSIAGIVTNLTLFLLCLAVAVGLNRLLWTDELYRVYRNAGSVEALINPYQGNLGYLVAYGNVSTGMSAAEIAQVTSFMATPWLQYVQRFFLLMAQINLSLAIFNFLPIPPLDGYHILDDLILKGRLRMNRQYFMIAQIALIVLIMSGVLGNLLGTVNSAVFSAVTHLFLLIAGAA